MAAPTAPRHVFMAKVGDTKQAIWILTTARFEPGRQIG